MKERKKIIIFAIIGIGFCMLLHQVIVAARNVGNHPDKIWLHRCNSLEKLHEKRHLYENIEVDLAFREESRTLDVTHDLDTTFHLDIKDYFKHFGQQKGKMWLDIKNLTASNKDGITETLEELCHTYGIAKERLIIESPSWRELQSLTQKGFYTSMYVNFDKPSRMTSAEREACVCRLQDIADSQCVKALSFPYWWYAEIKEKLKRPIDLLTWKHRTTQFVFLLSHEGKKMLEDKQLKVILVKDKGKFHR